MIVKLKKTLQILRICLILLRVEWKNTEFLMDLHRWKHILRIKENDLVALAQILWEKKEFRNLFIYRNRNKLLYRYWIKLVYPPLQTLYIESGKIGGGLFIQHGFSTIIAAESIGENCWINQQVTIGYTGNGTPTIGNNVMITCGAKVLGNIKVGNDVIIGANAVVINDVESDSVVGGVPARKLK